MDLFFNKINRSGIIEFIFISLFILINKITSFLKIILLRVRGYRVAFSVNMGSDIVIFQSTKHSITIGEGSFIGDGVRLKAGFSGKITIGKRVFIHDYSFIFAHNALVIGDNTLISPQVFITDFNHRFPHSKYKHLISHEIGYINKTVKIGKNVWIGAQTVILPGVSVGDDVIIGAGSVVTKNIPAGSTVVGNPARVIKKI